MRRERRNFSQKLQAEKAHVLEVFERKRREAQLKQDYSILQNTYQ